MDRKGHDFEVVVRTNDDVGLKDFNGADALLRPTADIESETTRVAKAAMPLILSLAIRIASEGEPAHQLKAFEFIKSVADGRMSIKTIKSTARKLKDEEINKILDGELREDID